MSYIFAAPAVDPKAQKQVAFAGYLGDICTITPNGARVCTPDVAPPVPAPAPATCPPCPPAPSCPAPVTCAPCPMPPVRPPFQFPTTLPVRPVLPPRPMPPTRITTGPGSIFARYSQLQSSARARMLEGLGDECQVYANGARVCNAPPAVMPGATAPAKLVRVCTNEPIDWKSMAMTNVMRVPFGIDIARTTVRTRQVCRMVPQPVAQPATPVPPYTTSTVAPVDNTTLLPAPVPAGADTYSGSSFDISSVPTWVYWALGLGGVYFVFFRK